MNWDPFQRDALEAMGLRLYAVHGTHAGAVAPAASADAPAAPDVDAESGNTVDAAVLRALLRACGRRADDEAALALCRSLVPAGGLRDAASRRALWPRLRALRARPAR